MTKEEMIDEIINILKRLEVLEKKENQGNIPDSIIFSDSHATQDTVHN